MGRIIPNNFATRLLLRILKDNKIYHHAIIYNEKTSDYKFFIDLLKMHNYNLFFNLSTILYLPRYFITNKIKLKEYQNIKKIYKEKILNIILPTISKKIDELFKKYESDRFFIDMHKNKIIEILRFQQNVFFELYDYQNCLKHPCIIEEIVNYLKYTDFINLIENGK